jgi:hypothetical protein
MTLTPCEKWLVQLLTDAPGNFLPASTIIARAREADAGSPATVQRAGSSVAIKSRRGGQSVWTLRRAHAPIASASPAAPEFPREGTPYDGWSIEALCAEAKRRGYWVSPHSNSETEIEYLLCADDDGDTSPELLLVPRSGRAPLPY